MGSPAQLSDDEKRELLRIARATLREFTATGRIPPGRPHRESLLAPHAAFVTLHHHGALRGCIGTCEATTPLYRTVQEMAIAAATKDPRFAALTRDELPTIEIEISALGSLRPITSPAEITIGIDGLVLEVDGHRGLLLPQVAIEAGWDAEALFAGVCTKAGVPVDAWLRPGALIHAFAAIFFNDKTHPPAARPGAQIRSR